MTIRAIGDIPQVSRGNHVYCNFPVSQSSEVLNESFLGTHGWAGCLTDLLPPVFPLPEAKGRDSGQNASFPGVLAKVTEYEHKIIYGAINLFLSVHCSLPSLCPHAKKAATLGRVSDRKEKNPELLDAPCRMGRAQSSIPVYRRRSKKWFFFSLCKL